MKKVLLISTFQEGAYSHIIRKVFREMNYSVFSFDHRSLNEIATREFKDICAMIDPDIIFSVKGRGIDPKAIKDAGGKKILWWLDNVTRFTDFEDYINVYDKYYVIEEGQGHPWMSIGIDPDIHRPQLTNDERFKSDLVFAGTGHGKRVQRVESILRNYPYNVKLWGNNWYSLKDKSLWTGNAIYFADLYKAYTMSSLILNVHYYPGITPNMRTIEAPASGTAMLSDTGAGINACLKPDKEYIPYESVKEARYLIYKYLEEPESLYSIGQNGMARVNKDHLLKDKLKEMIK